MRQKPESTQVVRMATLLIAALGVLPAVTGVVSALTYVHSYVYTRVEGEAVDKRLTSLEASQRADMREIRLSLMNLNNALLRSKLHVSACINQCSGNHSNQDIALAPTGALPPNVPLARRGEAIIGQDSGVNKPIDDGLKRDN